SPSGRRRGFASAQSAGLRISTQCAKITCRSEVTEAGWRQIRAITPGAATRLESGCLLAGCSHPRHDLTQPQQGTLNLLPPGIAAVQPNKILKTLFRRKHRARCNADLLCQRPLE